MNGCNWFNNSSHGFSPFQQFGFQTCPELSPWQVAQVRRHAHQRLNARLHFRRLAVHPCQQPVHRSIQLLDLRWIVLPLTQRALRHRHPPCAPADCSGPGTATASPRPRSCESPAPLPLCFSAPQTAAPPLAAVPPATYPPDETTLPFAPLLRIPSPWPAPIQSARARPPLAPGSIVANGPKSDSRQF